MRQETVYKVTCSKWGTSATITVDDASGVITLADNTLFKFQGKPLSILRTWLFNKVDKNYRIEEMKAWECY